MIHLPGGMMFYKYHRVPGWAQACPSTSCASCAACRCGATGHSVSNAQLDGGWWGDGDWTHPKNGDFSKDHEFHQPKSWNSPAKSWIWPSRMELTHQDGDTIQKCCFCWKVEPETALMGTPQQTTMGMTGSTGVSRFRHNVSSSQTPWGLQKNLKIPWSVSIFLVKTKKLGASRILDTAYGDESPKHGESTPGISLGEASHRMKPKATIWAGLWEYSTNT